MNRAPRIAARPKLPTPSRRNPAWARIGAMLVGFALLAPVAAALGRDGDSVVEVTALPGAAIDAVGFRSATTSVPVTTGNGASLAIAPTSVTQLPGAAPAQQSALALVTSTATATVAPDPNEPPVTVAPKTSTAADATKPSGAVTIQKKASTSATTVKKKTSTAGTAQKRPATSAEKRPPATVEPTTVKAKAKAKAAAAPTTVTTKTKAKAAAAPTPAKATTTIAKPPATKPSVAATTKPSVAATTKPSVAATTKPSVAATTKPSVAATTPSPQASPARSWTRAEVEQIIRDAWPDELEGRALAIAQRESHLTPTSRNWCCYGLFAIHFKAGKRLLNSIGITSAEQLFDPATNARAAYAIYQVAGWGPWKL